MTGLEALKELRENAKNDRWIEQIFKNEWLNVIEKELKALVALKDLFDFDFALRFPNNQPMLKITNKLTFEDWEIPITQELYNLLKEVLKNE